jgi:hypothetical protein
MSNIDATAMLELHGPKQPDRQKFLFSGLLDSCDRTHSALMFAALISAAHFSISLLINFWRYSGDRRSGATKMEPNSSGAPRSREPARLGQEYYTLSAGSERDLGTAFALCLSGKTSMLLVQSDGFFVSAARNQIVALGRKKPRSIFYVEPEDHRSHVRFSNRPSGVKHFQAIHHASVDVAHGLALLFGLGTKALP